MSLLSLSLFTRLLLTPSLLRLSHRSSPLGLLLALGLRGSLVCPITRGIILRVVVSPALTVYNTPTFIPKAPVVERRIVRSLACFQQLLTDAPDVRLRWLRWSFCSRQADDSREPQQELLAILVVCVQLSGCSLRSGECVSSAAGLSIARSACLPISLHECGTEEASASLCVSGRSSLRHTKPPQSRKSG